MENNRLPWLLIIAGVILMVAPMIFPLSVSVPQSYPWIPEGYYSKGKIDYVSPQTGKYYLACCPISENGVSISSAKVKFLDLDVEYSMTQKYIPIDYDEYDWYNFQCEFDVASPLEYYTNYSIQFSVVDAKGRTCSVDSRVEFIPVEPLPEPQGYFTINGKEAYEDTTLLLLSPELNITFTPTQYAEYIDHVDIKVYRNGDLIDFITNQELPNSPRFYMQSDGSWRATYTLPESGVYTFEGYVSTEQRTIQLLSINLNYGAPPSERNAEMLQLAGVALVAVGVVVLTKRSIAV